MTHEHHHHERTVTSLNKAFILGIALNVAFVVVEFAVGLSYGSMGLLSDAGHNLSDVASLLLAMLAFRLAQAQATPRYTYGYKKSTVLISLLNSVILLIAVGVIVAESIGRMLHPAPVEGGAIAWTAGVGGAVNGFTAGLSIPILSNRHNVKRAHAMEQAAKANTESALAQQRSSVRELYLKVDYTGRLLESFGGLPDAAGYIDMLGRTLEAGQINIVDYYSELDTFYSALETRIRTDLEYRLGLARLNVIYM